MNLTKENNCGRSMIEMLGVLALVAVLTVGGIEGFGKAMRMWHSNQQKQYLSELLTAFISLRESLGRMNETKTSSIRVIPVLEAMNEIPEGMTVSGYFAFDKQGNRYGISYGLATWSNQDGSTSSTREAALTVRLVKSESMMLPSSEDLCFNIFTVAKENIQDIAKIHFFQGNSDSWNGYNQTTPFSLSALRVATPAQIMEKCKTCNSQSYCEIGMYLKMN